MREIVINFVTVMGLLGIPSIFAMTKWCIKTCKEYNKKIEIMMKAQQAQMRARLLEMYHFYMSQGFISDEDMAEWENQYQSYHALGINGVLDVRREALLGLPSNKEDE